MALCVSLQSRQHEEWRPAKAVFPSPRPREAVRPWLLEPSDLQLCLLIYESSQDAWSP